jgi:hypothetical protein
MDPETPEKDTAALHYIAALHSLEDDQGGIDLENPDVRVAVSQAISLHCPFPMESGQWWDFQCNQLVEKTGCPTWFRAHHGFGADAEISVALGRAHNMVNMHPDRALFAQVVRRVDPPDDTPEDRRQTPPADFPDGFHAAVMNLIENPFGHLRKDDTNPTE